MIAVSTVCIFLVCVVVPLFLPASYSTAKPVPLSPAMADCLHFEIDEYRAVGWAMSPDAVLRIFRLDTGAVIHESPCFPTIVRRPGPSASVVAKPSAGSPMEACARFAWVLRQHFPTSLRSETTCWQSSVETSTGVRRGTAVAHKQGQLRLQSVRAVASEPIVPAGSAAVACVDSSTRPIGRVCCVLDLDGHLNLHAVRRRLALAREAIDSHAVDVAIPYAPSTERGAPDSCSCQARQTMCTRYGAMGTCCVMTSATSHSHDLPSNLICCRSRSDQSRL